MNTKQELHAVGSLYRDYRGEFYTVVGFAEHAETGETLVIYDGIYPVKRRAIPLSVWNETVTIRAGTFPRFSYVTWDEKTIESIWDLLEDVPFDEDEDGNLILAEPFYIFEEGTSREEIWHWFDKVHPKGVHYLLCERGLEL